MKMSGKGIELLRSIEAFRDYAYDDQNGEEIEAWVPGATIGYGHLIEESEWNNYCGKTMGLLEAEILFSSDITPFEFAVEAACDDPPNSHQFDAMVMLAFNIGIRGFQQSSAIKLINNSLAITPYKNLEDAWKAWNKDRGKVVQGLVNRRNAEWDIFSKGIYARW